MEIREESALSYIFTAINSILELPGSEYTFDLVETNKQNTNGYSDYQKRIVCIDHKIWNNFVDEKDATTKRVNYAIAAGTIAHEIMHIYQFLHPTIQTLKDFVFEGNLPSNPNEWSAEQKNDYFNLSIEIEAFAFGMLLESILLLGERISLLPQQMDKTLYDKAYLRLEKIYKSKIENAFSKLL